MADTHPAFDCRNHLIDMVLCEKSQGSFETMESVKRSPGSSDLWPGRNYVVSIPVFWYDPVILCGDGNDPAGFKSDSHSAMQLCVSETFSQME